MKSQTHVGSVIHRSVQLKATVRLLEDGSG